MNKNINKYLFNLVSEDLKRMQIQVKVLENVVQKGQIDDDYWRTKVNSTNNKINLAKKSLEYLVSNPK